jgi:hypothetical protein
MWQIHLTYGELEVDLGLCDDWADVMSIFKGMKPGDSIDQITITRVVR